jgi:hypothetical protein
MFSQLLIVQLKSFLILQWFESAVHSTVQIILQILTFAQLVMFSSSSLFMLGSKTKM